MKDEVLRTRARPLARFEETYPGSDGQVRAVKLKCKNKTYTRASTLLIPFSPDETSSQARVTGKLVQANCGPIGPNPLALLVWADKIR